MGKFASESAKSGYSFRYGFARMIHKSADTFPQVADTFPGVLVVRIVERRLEFTSPKKISIKYLV